MSKKTILFITIASILLMLQTVYAYEEESFRLKSFGTELKWIMDDEYTDIFLNPAAINVLTSNRMLTNYSNMNSSNSLLVGAFRKVKDWKIGVILEGSEEKDWHTFPYEMRTTIFNNYYQFDWYQYSYYSNVNTNNEGIWITDHDNGTTTTDDDYQIIEEKQGLVYDNYEEDFNLNILLGKGNYGFSYHIYRSSNWNSLLSSNLKLKENMQNAYHSYILTEVGDNSPVEAINAVQQEINDYSNEITKHDVTFGWNKTLNERIELDIVAGSNYTIENEDIESVKEKQIDYDPDNDGILYPSPTKYPEYDRYSYQALETFKDKLSGLGYQFDTRLTIRKKKGKSIKIFCRTNYQTLSADNYEESFKEQEMMTAFDEDDQFDSSYYISRSGEKNTKFMTFIFGFGGTKKPLKDLEMGIGAKYSYNYNKITYDLVTGEGASYFKEETTILNRIVLPIGFEYLLKNRFAIRWGIDVSIWSEEITSKIKGDEITNGDLQYLDVSSKNVDEDLDTTYSYGFGYSLSDKIQIDLVGRYNSSISLSSYDLSLILKY